MEKLALVAITKHGVDLIRHLHAHFPTADVYYMSKFAYGDEEEKGYHLFEGSVKLQLPMMFAKYNGIVMVISIGAVVRMIAPLLKDKKEDPAVVVIDDKGQFAISVLSGHIGGANDLTRQVARYLQATPVVTTASDVQKTIPVDIFGRELGFVLEDFDNVTAVSAAVVNEEPVLIVQESGETNWWTYDRPLPNQFRVSRSLDDLLKTNEFSKALIITHKILQDPYASIAREHGVIYRPKSVHLGIGCNRGTSAEEIKRVIIDTLQEQQISLTSVKRIATIDLKKDEVGLLEVCEELGIEFVYYPPEQLNKMPVKNRSDVVYKYTGAYGVSEPAAMLSANTKQLVLEKKKSGNVTISIAVSRGGQNAT